MKQSKKRTGFLTALTTLAMFGVSACGSGPDQENPEAFAPETQGTPTETAGAPLTAAPIQYREGSGVATVIAHPSPNDYSVKLNWSWERPLNGFFVITRKQVDGNGRTVAVQPIATLRSNVFEVMDEQPAQPKLTYIYEIQAQDVSGETELVSAPKVKIPVDFVVSGNMDATSLPFANPATKIVQIGGFNRIFFRSNAVLFHFGYDLVLQANEIISDNGRIESFGAGTKAPVDQPGVNAGAVEIQAKDGQGVLKVISRGSDGGDGHRGSDGYQGGQGPNGGDARNHDHCTRGCEEKGTQRCPLKPEEQQTMSCYKQCDAGAQPGGQGGQGGAAGSGSNGQPGGNSGSLKIRISDATQIKIQPEVIAGKGGAGGAPGNPGPGGPGGYGGRGADSCGGDAPMGPTGPQGPSASRGADGATGKALPVCLELSSKKECK